MTNSEKIDKLFEYVKKHDFELVHHLSGNKVKFFTTRAEWICWCCGALRVMINGRPKCVYGILYREDIVRPDGNPCEHYRDSGCIRNSVCNHENLCKGYP